MSSKISDHLFLYLDILGFRELLADPSQVEELYAVVDSLNVFTHDAFECIVFSDTLLIYDKSPISTDDERTKISIMWLCEFAQDLLYRLIPRDRHFRALLTCGPFKSRDLVNFKYFYGQALVDTYEYESKIQSTGLYIDNRLTPHSNIFKTSKCDEKYDYVYLTQDMNTIAEQYETYDPKQHAYFIEAQGLEGLYIYDFLYLENIYRNMNDATLPNSVRTKYQNTWSFLQRKYDRVMAELIANSFDPRCIIDLDWQYWVDRIRKGDGFHG